VRAASNQITCRKVRMPRRNHFADCDAVQTGVRRHYSSQDDVADTGNSSQRPGGRAGGR